TAAEFVEGLLSDETSAAVEAHIDICPECRQFVSELAKSSATAHSYDARNDREPSLVFDDQKAMAPTTIGRYVVLAPLGSGGMGIVYAAYDPELDRKIALKLLRPDLGDAATVGASRARLLREAQAMA